MEVARKISKFKARRRRLLMMAALSAWIRAEKKKRALTLLGDQLAYDLENKRKTKAYHAWLNRTQEMVMRDKNICGKIKTRRKARLLSKHFSHWRNIRNIRAVLKRRRVQKAIQQWKSNAKRSVRQRSHLDSLMRAALLYNCRRLVRAFYKAVRFRQMRRRESMLRTKKVKHAHIFHLHLLFSLM
jgi:hypothetical protein